MQRRTVLKVIGGALVAVGGGAGAFLTTRTPARALAPWAAAGEAVADPRVFVFRHAILAPNPHNRQPWVITLVGADEAVITCDLDRRLPITDPFDRQITIGFGCFLGLARIAAAERGLRLQITPFAEGEPTPRLDARPIAHLRFVPDASVKPDPLFAVIRQRRSVKEPYDTARPVPASMLQTLAGAAQATTPQVRPLAISDTAAVARLREITQRAFEIEVATPPAYRESVDLMRIGKAEIEANPDGIDLGGPLFDSLALAGLLTRERIFDPADDAHRQGLEAYREMFSSSMAFLALMTRGNRRVDQLAVGEAHVRSHLAATGLGLALHPISQGLQEYAEVREVAAATRTALGLQADETPQMLSRLGFYGETVAPSPRWPLDAKLKRA